MKKRIKLLFSLMAFCVALASLIFGVYAAQTFSYQYNGNMSYDVNYGFLQIETSVYKYNKKPLTKNEAQEYYKDFSELIPMTNYSHSYCTYDSNNLLKGTIENQSYNLNFEFDEAFVFFVVVNVKSLSTDPIKATVTSNYNIDNSWSDNSGDTVILKNDSGENIIFSNGIINMFQKSEGSFSYNIDFDLQEEYTPEETGTLQYSALNEGITPFSQTFNKKTEADDFVRVDSIELAGNQLISDTKNNAVILNLMAGDFFYNHIISIRLKNIRLYNSTGDLINDTMVYYTYVSGGILTSVQALDGLDLTTMPRKCTIEVPRLKEGKSALALVINDEVAIQAINKVTFDIEVEMTEKVERSASNVNYEYKITAKLDETVVIMPGKNTSKNVEEMEFYGGSYDIVDAPDYAIEARLSINHAMKYIEKFGRYVIPTMKLNPDFYGNILVWIQAVLLMYSTQTSVFGEIGYLPIPLEDTVLPVDDGTTITFLRNDWAVNIEQMITLANYISKEELISLAGQYLMPIPSDLDESINIPFQIGRLKNFPITLFTNLQGIIESMIISNGQPNFEAPMLDFTILINAIDAELFRQSPKGPESFGLSRDFRLTEFMELSNSGLLSNADPGITEGQIQTVTLDYLFFVPGTTFPNLEGAKVTECYYESVDTVIYNADSTDLDLYAMPIKEYKTDNSNLIVDDGVLYNKNKTLAKYPSLKSGGMYNVVEGTKTIARNAFSGSKNLSRVTLPKSIETIDTTAFEESSVATLYVYRELINNYTWEMIDILNKSNVVQLYVMVDGYLSDARYTKLSEKVYCSVNKLVVDNQCGLAFALGEDGAYVSGLLNRDVEYIVIPSSVEIDGETETVTRIGQNAFKNCINLNTIEIPSSIKTIGDDAFMGCPNLTEIYFDGAKIEEIGTGNLRKGMFVYAYERTTANLAYSAMENAYCIEWSCYSYPESVLFEIDYTLTIGLNTFNLIGTYCYTESKRDIFNQYTVISMETNEEQSVIVHAKATTQDNDDNDLIRDYLYVTKTPKGENSSSTFIGSSDYVDTEGKSIDKTFPSTGLGVLIQTDAWIVVRIGLGRTEVS